MAEHTLPPEDREARIAALAAELAALKAERTPAVKRRSRNRLTEQTIRRLREPRLHADGGGLYLDAKHPPHRSWIVRYSRGGKTRELGIGPYPRITLAEARRRRDAALALLDQGIDPVDKRREERLAQRVEKVRTPTFRQCAERHADAQSQAWRSLKHAQQHRASLARFVYPRIGDLPIDQIDTGKVLEVIEPLWMAGKVETGSRVRGRIEAVLSWAKVRGYRAGENPARWRGHLDSLLPARGKAQPAQHFRAMAYRDVPQFYNALGEQSSLAALALRFLILTSARSGEVLGATWEEFDPLAGRTWTIAGQRMKAGKEHRVPLSDAALAIIEQIGQLPRRERVFPIGNTEMWRLASAAGVTTHGFRSAFRQWAAEQTSVPSEIAEMALAHAVGSAVERAYQRSDLFDLRRRLAEQWSHFVVTPSPTGAEIVPIRA
jgi:integrase